MNYPKHSSMNWIHWKMSEENYCQADQPTKRWEERRHFSPNPVEGEFFSTIYLSLLHCEYGSALWYTIERFINKQGFVCSTQQPTLKNGNFSCGCCCGNGGWCLSLYLLLLLIVFVYVCMFVWICLCSFIFCNGHPSSARQKIVEKPLSIVAESQLILNVSRVKTT